LRGRAAVPVAPSATLLIRKRELRGVHTRDGYRQHGGQGRGGLRLVPVPTAQGATTARGGRPPPAQGPTPCGGKGYTWGVAARGQHHGPWGGKGTMLGVAQARMQAHTHHGLERGGAKESAQRRGGQAGREGGRGEETRMRPHQHMHKARTSHLNARAGGAGSPAASRECPAPTPGVGPPPATTAPAPTST